MENETPSTTVINVSPATDTAFLLLQDEVTNIVKWAEGRVVANQEDANGAANDLLLVRKLKKAVEDKRVENLQPLRNFTDQINDAFKQLSEPLTLANKQLGDKILAYQAELDRQRQVQEEINRKRMEAAKAEMELSGELTESVNLVEVIEAPTKINGDLGSAGQRDNWKWEVEDISLVPHEYLMPNAGIITGVVKASKGKITIPGIRIFNEPILAVRTR